MATSYRRVSVILPFTTLQLKFSVYSGKKLCKNKYVKILELINKVKKKKDECKQISRLTVD